MEAANQISPFNPGAAKVGVLRKPVMGTPTFQDFCKFVTWHNYGDESCTVNWICMDLFNVDSPGQL